MPRPRGEQAVLATLSHSGPKVRETHGLEAAALKKDMSASPRTGLSQDARPHAHTSDTSTSTSEPAATRPTASVPVDTSSVLQAVLDWASQARARRWMRECSRSAQQASSQLRPQPWLKGLCRP